MRVARTIIAAAGLLGGLGGCYYQPEPAAYPMPTVASAPEPVPLTRCGRCEEHVVVISPMTPKF